MGGSQTLEGELIIIRKENVETFLRGTVGGAKKGGMPEEGIDEKKGAEGKREGV